MPLAHSRSEIAANGDAKDPFLYDPRLKAVEAGKVSLDVTLTETC